MGFGKFLKKAVNTVVNVANGKKIDSRPPHQFDGNGYCINCGGHLQRLDNRDNCSGASWKNKKR